MSHHHDRVELIAHTLLCFLGGVAIYLALASRVGLL